MTKQPQSYKGLFLIPDIKGWRIINNHGKQLYSKPFSLAECKKKIDGTCRGKK